MKGNGDVQPLLFTRGNLLSEVVEQITTFFLTSAETERVRFSCSRRSSVCVWCACKEERPFFMSTLEFFRLPLPSTCSVSAGRWGLSCQRCFLCEGCFCRGFNCKEKVGGKKEDFTDVDDAGSVQYH